MKKGPKRTFILGASFVAAVSFAGCGKLYASPPGIYDDTPTPTIIQPIERGEAVLEFSGLDFDILQIVNSANLEGHVVIDKSSQYTREYLGKKYTAVPAQEGERSPRLPADGYVSYTVSPYPDKNSKEMIVTKIVITDPKVTVFGHSIHTMDWVFADTLKEKGFTTKNPHYMLGEATKDGVTIHYSNGMIRIEAKVPN